MYWKETSWMAFGSYIILPAQLTRHTWKYRPSAHQNNTDKKKASEEALNCYSSNPFMPDWLAFTSMSFQE
tara:strand:+ start:584 stop:793 length:210 start_codon:yes stop_codon:yes gene_type:complete